MDMTWVGMPLPMAQYFNGRSLWSGTLTLLFYFFSGLCCHCLTISSFQRCSPLETQRSWPCHINLIVLLSPLDEQISPRQCHSDPLLPRSRNLPGADRSHNQRARPRAAREGRPSATLPHLHLQVRGTHHLDELHVRLGREGARVAFQSRSVALEIDILFQIVNEDNRVGVAHRDQRYLPFLTVASVHLFQYAVVFRVGSEGGWDGRTVEDGFTHVDSDGAIRVHCGDDEASEGVDSVGLSICTQVLQKLGKAPNTITAHFRFRSIAIVDSHGKVIVSLFWSLERENYTISTNTKVTIA
mmetsp:Transcript_3710/g.9439  ORF Transcript_3710/g.9439 Transcript_3710/m.9439 type:complete len:299 (+) Transcript_3710:169-1065(+)